MTTLDQRVRAGVPRLVRREMVIIVVEGTVGALKIEEEGGSRVLRFLVQPDEGAPVPIEMRGEQLRGVLIEGHRVDIRFAGRSLDRGDATLRPRELRNLTTNGVVCMWRPGWLRSAVRMMSPGEFRSAAISAVVGA